MDRARFLRIVAIILAMYCIYCGAFGMIDAQRHMAIYLSFVFVLVFLSKPLLSKGPGPWVAVARWIDYLLAALGVVVGLYIVVNFHALNLRAGMPTQLDIRLGILTTLLVIEVTRRTAGSVLPILAVFSLVYALAGQYFPQPFTHAGVSVNRLFNFMYLTFSAIFSTPLSAVATYITLFILWGALLEGAKAVSVFINLALWLTGRSRGGAAKTAVVASALMGTVSGSGTANVVATGAFTIPLMKRLGYQPHFAGAVEAAASSGGQIMPPVMGAAAFLIAETLAIPYIKVALCALLPAVLYYVSIFVSVDMEAARLGLGRMSADERRFDKSLLLKYGPFFLSPAVLVFFLTVPKVSLSRASFWALAAVVLVSLLRKDTRMTLSQLGDCLDEGIKAILGVAASCACAGIILGVINMTGLGLRLSGILVQLGGGSLFATAVLTMIASLILGMGLPTTACYIVLSIVVAPTLVSMGVAPLAAHMFIFYFGIMSTITPPVALAAYAGAGIAGAPQFKTGMTAVQLALPGFVLPYLFIYSPAILMQGTWQMAVFDFCRLCLAFCGLACALTGMLFAPIRIGTRAIMIAAAILIIMPSLSSTAVGFVLGAAACSINYMYSRRRGTVAA